MVRLRMILQFSHEACVLSHTSQGKEEEEKKIKKNKKKNYSFINDLPLQTIHILGFFK